MSSAEIKIHLFREIDKLGEAELAEAYQLLMNWRNQVSEAKAKERPLGTMSGLIVFMAEDFDAPLPDFKDYM
ncbi:MAG: hypothetical protein AAGM67_00965 [Bacteroidota bacterium]